MRAPKNYLHINVRLADFGEAVADTGHNNHLIQPLGLRAPEVILGIGWNCKADIWNLGCVVGFPALGRILPFSNLHMYN